MEVVVGKKIPEMKNPHKRLAAYIEVMEKIARTSGAEPHASYLRIKAERDGIPENRDFLNKPLAEVKQYLQNVAITEIEYTIPATFRVGNKLWHAVGEGPSIGITRFDVGVVARIEDTEEVRNLKKTVEALPADYYIEFDKKRFAGKA